MTVREDADTVRRLWMHARLDNPWRDAEHNKDAYKRFLLVAEDAIERLVAAAAKADTLGNELAQERAKPGGAWDQAAFAQIQGQAHKLAEAVQEFILDGSNSRLPSYTRMVVALAEVSP